MANAGVVFAAASVIGALFSTQHWAFDSLAQFLLPSLWTLVAAPVVLIGCLLVSRVSVWHAITLPASIAALIVGASIVRSSDATSPANGFRLSVYQHNIYVENTVFERVVETVERTDPDIIALVEARDSTLAPFEARLAERWPYTAGPRSVKQSYARLRLFSKYEIIGYTVQKRDYEPATLNAQLKTPAGEITVLIAHFTRPWPFKPPESQMRHYRALEDILRDINGPAVLLGDFNSTPWGRIGRPLQTDHGFQLANQPAIGTWPGRVNIDDMMDTVGLPRFATIPIDLAFCRGGAVCTAHRVGENLGSDHRYTQFEVWLTDSVSEGSEPGQQ